VQFSIMAEQARDVRTIADGVLTRLARARLLKRDRLISS